VQRSDPDDFLTRTEENKKKLQSGYPASSPRIDSGIPRISSSANYLTVKLGKEVAYKIF
jgi:hypothetical protein